MDKHKFKNPSLPSVTTKQTLLVKEKKKKNSRDIPINICLFTCGSLRQNARGKTSSRGKEQLKHFFFSKGVLIHRSSLYLPSLI